jgi:cysteine desulfurase
MEVYFDNSATTKPYDEVVEVMYEALKNCYGNPSSAYSLGIQSERKINEAREIVAKSLNASKEEIIFTSCGSESNNFLIKGFIKPDSHIITTKIEHPSVYKTLNSLEKEGIETTYLNVDRYGRIDIDELVNNIKSTTQIVSIIFVNNEIGNLQDISRIGKAIKEKSSRVKFHVDAVQGYGKHKIDVKEMNIDLLSVSGHKIHGPKGVGVSYIRKGLDPKPLIYGGGQERGLRSGTENVASIIGLGKAAEIVFNRIDSNYNNILELKNYFAKGLTKLSDVKLNSELDDTF